MGNRKTIQQICKLVLILKILALDSSQSSGSVAILEEEQILYETLWEAETGHTVKLSSEVQTASLQTKIPLSEIDLFAVTIGPGSFTGIRVALSFVKGMTLLQKKPVVGVSTLLALASSVSEEGLICPLLDARREEIFSAVYHHVDSTYLSYLEERAESPQIFFDCLHQKILQKEEPLFLLGSGVRKYSEFIKIFPPVKTVVLDPSYDSVKATVVARIGANLFQKGEFSKGGETLVPQYLRASEAELRLKEG